MPVATLKDFAFWGMLHCQIHKYLVYQLLVALTAFFHLRFAACVAVPSSSCYALDNSSRLVDFTDWTGYPFEYNGKDSDLVVRFCKDVESRSQEGYLDFGRFETLDDFLAGSGSVDFVQQFYSGDLLKCEQTFDKMGRTAQVNIICGSCSNAECKGPQREVGCICGVTYDRKMCRAFIELAMPCAKRGPRVFKGFTAGFHPRSWEVVYNGMTQLGYDELHHEFRLQCSYRNTHPPGWTIRQVFETGQTHISLYFTAISALSDLVGKPSLKVKPDNGLTVQLSGSAKDGKAPTTLSPTVLNIDWRCVVARDTPYEIEISIPVKDYDPIQFKLTKLCGYVQGIEDDAGRGWATFGIISCIFIVLSTIFCCGGFIYKTRVEHQHGLDALPGMTVLSACLEAVSGPRGYQVGLANDGNFVSQFSQEHLHETERTNDRQR